MHTLILRHVADSDPPRFQVTSPGGRATSPLAVVPPTGFPVEGRPGSDLLKELQWYLETFLDYPFSPETEHAERVLAALRSWGEQAFKALFDNRDGGGMLTGAKANGYEHLLLQIWSDEPEILAWPWEALRDPQGSALAPACQIERRLDTVGDPAPVPPGLPTDRVNILLVIARPYERDVNFRSISRPLVELIAKHNLPAHVHVLRPPTFDRLREHLHERPNHYHLVHFDGHGAYGEAPAPTGPHTYHAPEGRLVFENDKGEAAPATAEKLSTLLQEYRVPAMVLNACQSAMLDDKAADPFASVAASLLKAGTRSVVAMSYSLYVSGAQQFLPAFYRRLFETGSFADAARAGRQQMFSERGRVCSRGHFDLQDWLVPVVYQQATEVLSFAAAARPPASSRKGIPEGAIDGDLPYGFIGRDGPLLQLERALRRSTPAILIHGLGGVGKTTLARGFVEWLAATEGLGDGCLWLSFHDIRSAEYVVNRLGEPLLGGAFSAASLDQKLDALIRVFKQKRFLLVWDNFEVVAGYPGCPATMSDVDQGHLRLFLQRLRGAPTKVLITSRSEEDWLGPELRRKVAIGGLLGEEQWAYCEAILGDLGIAIDLKDKDLGELMNQLGGHPLAMRVVLPRLEKQRAEEVSKALRSNLAALRGNEDEPLRKLYATLRFVEEGLPEVLRPLLVPLGLHERNIDGRFLAAMALQVDAGWTRDRIDRFLGALVHAGLLHDHGQAVYGMHPVLSGYLRSGSESSAPGAGRDGWCRAFVNIMGRVADDLAPRKLHDQRAGFHCHAANFYHASTEAEQLGMGTDYAALVQGLAAYAQNMRSFSEARKLFERLARANEVACNQVGEAAAYHHLGMIAEEQRDFAAAEAWYHKSLAIKEKQGNDSGAASTYHHLGSLAQEQRDFAAAEAWYRKSLAIFERQGNDSGAASTYHQLGMIAEDQCDFATAEDWYRKSVAIFERQGNEHGAASAYHQLGIIAQLQRDFAAAEAWYHKSLTITEKQGNDHGAASTYHQLGMSAQLQRDFAAAETWYHKSLTITEKQGNDHGAASTYHHLGSLAQDQHDFAAAETWYYKSLAITEKQGNDYGAASTYHQIGSLAQDQHDFAAAETWYYKSLAIKEKQGNERGAASTYHHLGNLAQEQRDFAAAEDWYRRSLAVTEKQGNERGAATTYGQLGILAGIQEHFEDSGQWLVKCILAFMRSHDPEGARENINNFAIFYRGAAATDQSKLKAIWEAAGLGKLPIPDEPQR